MKRINANHDNKDRIICVTVNSKHKFYYQPVGTRELFWLFDTKDFSGSVYTYFRKNGRNIIDRDYSLTIKEIYEFKDYHNSKLTRIINRIPSHVEYVIRENCSYLTEYESVAVTIEPVYYCYSGEDYDIA